MKVVDKRLNSSEVRILANTIGKSFVKYRCDKILFRPAAYQAVGAFFDDAVISIENESQILDYYGSIEDVGVLSVKQVSSEAVVSRVVDGEQIDTPINQHVQDVQVVEDTHTMFNGSEDLHEFSYTKAIVFVMPDRQVVFEKDVWFSEDILIYRGRDAAAKIMPVEDEIEESDTYGFRAERVVKSLANQLSISEN